MKFGKAQQLNKSERELLSRFPAFAVRVTVANLSDVGNAFQGTGSHPRVGNVIRV